MASRSSRFPSVLTAVPAVLIVLSFVVLLNAGCSLLGSRPSKKFNELLNRYPQTQDPLQVQRLTAGSAEAASLSRRGRPVTIIVHPAYSLFFRDANRSVYTEARYDLLKLQLENEARFIAEIAKTDNVVILVLPGNYERDSVSSKSYIGYLNSLAGGSPSVYYVTSETSSSGALPLATVVMLHGFVRSLDPPAVLVGGGFIGRCQREFYNQVINYVGDVPAYIVPEISSVSPDDVSDSKARTILDGILLRDYDPLREFIERRSQGRARITRLPGDWDWRAVRASGASEEPVRDGGALQVAAPEPEQGTAPDADPGREKEPPVH